MIQKQHTTSLSSLIRVNENAEKLIIGTLLTIPNSIMNICEGFCAEYFYDDFLREIYKAISYLDSEGKKIDILTVSDVMRKNGIDSDLTKLSELCESYTYDLMPHSLMVKEKAIERGVVSLIQRSLLRLQENEDVGDMLFEIGEKISSLQESLIGASQSEHISIAVSESIEELDRRIENRKKGLMSGIPTGLSDLDKHTGGWQKQDLMIIAGRPGMGKTSTMLTFAKAAAENKISVAIFSLEMGKRQLTDKMIIGESGVMADSYKYGVIQSAQKKELDAAANNISLLPIYIDDRPSVSISYVRSRCRLLHKQGRCGMVIIDYLQLMSGTREQNGNREQEISSISRGCKAIAKELDIPVILLSQLNRKCEDRADKRPMLQDLRESGAIEQDADIVCFIHRPEKYNLECLDYDQNIIKNGMELIFAKFRNGSTGVLYAQHDEAFTKLYDVNTGQYQENVFKKEQIFKKEEFLPF